jgi:hypothetical protein
MGDMPPTPSSGRWVISSVALSGNSSRSLTSIGPAKEARDDVEPMCASDKGLGVLGRTAYQRRTEQNRQPGIAIQGSSRWTESPPVLDRLSVKWMPFLIVAVC